MDAIFLMFGILVAMYVANFIWLDCDASRIRVILEKGDFIFRRGKMLNWKARTN